MRFPLQIFYNWYVSLLRNPKYRWLAVLGALVYLISPLDILPDIFPLLGQIDDFVILSVLISELSTALMGNWKNRPGSDNPSGETVDVDAVSID